MVLGFMAQPAIAVVPARYIRVDNPTGFVMEFRQVEIYSAGRNVVAKHPEMISGTVLAQPDNPEPTRTNTILRGGRAANDLTGGDTDVSHRAQAWTAYTDPK